MTSNLFIHSTALPSAVSSLLNSIKSIFLSDRLGQGFQICKTTSENS
jgi:hypothetical protein